MSRHDVFPTFYLTAFLLRRIWRFFRPLLAIAGLLLLVAYVVVNRTAGAALEREMAQLREQGEPLSLREAAPPQVAEEENAALLYAQAFERLPRLSRASTSTGQINPQLSAADERVLKEIVPERGEPIGSASTPQVRALLAGTEESLALFRKAAAMPRCRFPVDWEAGAGALFPHYPQLLVLTRMMAAHAVLAASEGRTREAMDDISAIVGMSRHLAGEPIMIGLLVQYRCLSIAGSSLKRVLETSSPPAEACLRLDRQLSELDMQTPLERAVQSERCLGFWCFDVLASDPAKYRGILGADAPVLQVTTRLGPLRSPLAKMDELFYLRTMARMETRARQRDLASAGERKEADLPVPWYASVSRFVLPAFDSLLRKQHQALARLALARCGLAVAAYRQQIGAFPTSLADVEQTASRSLPRDPFTGQGLIYHPQGTGYVMYSLGINGRDDEGQNANDRDPRSDRRPAQGQDDIAWSFHPEPGSPG